MFASATLRRLIVPIAPLALVALAACSDSSSSNAAPVALSFATRSEAITTAPANGATVGAGTTIIVGGTDTLRLTSVRLVIDELELLRTTSGTCTGDSGHDSGADDSGHHAAGTSGDCFAFESGPYLVELPLDGNVSSAISVAIPSGSYSKLEMKLRQADSGEDRAFNSAHAEMNGITVLASGTYRGQPFTWRGNVEASLEMHFPQAMVVDGAGNITVSIDVGGWFRTGTGAIIDPATAGEGQANFATVAQNIRASFGAFEDDDHDGRDDHGGRNDD